MTTAAQLPRDLRELLSQRHTCLRCKSTFIELNNIGRWQCRQTYYMYGLQFSVPADHMAADDDLTPGRHATADELRQAWFLYQFDEKSDIVMDSRYAAIRPDPRAIVMDTGDYDNDARGAEQVRRHHRHITVTGADHYQSAQLVGAMALCADDDDSDYSADDDDDESDSDDDQFGGTMTSFTKQMIIRRYDWKLLSEYMTTTVPRARRAHELRTGNVPRVPFEHTAYGRSRRHIARVYRIGYAD